MAKLLLAEDDRIIASIYERKFGAEGYQVTTVTDGEAALGALERSPRDCVFQRLPTQDHRRRVAGRCDHGTDEVQHQ